MYEACVVMNVANRVDDDFINGLKHNFHQITRVEREADSLNLIIHLMVNTDKEIKDFYSEIEAMVSLAM